MTVFEKIKSMNIDEFAEWFTKYCHHDTDPCICWWDDNYCLNCEPVIVRHMDSDLDSVFAWCELYGKCRFFNDMDKTPDLLQMTKIWLKSEA